MALKLKLLDSNNNISTVYLKKDDIESVVFGKDVKPNPNYKPIESDSQEEQEYIPEILEIPFCRINFYRQVEVNEPYESVTRTNGKEKKVVKERKVSVNDYWIIFDTTQFEDIETWVELNL